MAKPLMRLQLNGLQSKLNCCFTIYFLQLVVPCQISSRSKFLAETPCSYVSFILSMRSAIFYSRVSIMHSEFIFSRNRQ